jgi:hypothetical protein
MILHTRISKNFLWSFFTTIVLHELIIQYTFCLSSILMLDKCDATELLTCRLVVRTSIPLSVTMVSQGEKTHSCICSLSFYVISSFSNISNFFINLPWFLCSDLLRYLFYLPKED